MGRIGIKTDGKKSAKRVGVKATGPSGNPDPSGPALAQDRATQFLLNNSPLSTGNINYKSPGSAGGMT